MLKAGATRSCAGARLYVYSHFAKPLHGRVFGGEREQMQDHETATVTVILEPNGGTRVMERPKTVTQLLNRLAVRQGTALVIRDGQLLTPDRRIEKGEVITVRTVVSRG